MPEIRQEHHSLPAIGLCRARVVENHLPERTWRSAACKQAWGKEDTSLNRLNTPLSRLQGGMDICPDLVLEGVVEDQATALFLGSGTRELQGQAAQPLLGSEPTRR